jgi:hypothetical protein
MSMVILDLFWIFLTCTMIRLSFVLSGHAWIFFIIEVSMHVLNRCSRRMILYRFVGNFSKYTHEFSFANT